MSKKIVGLILVATLGLTLMTGCIGRMAVSGNVMKWNLEATESKWGRQVVFLCLYIIPVYPIAGMIDLLIVNSIEFHRGTNPVSGQERLARAGETRTVEAADGTKSVSTLREDGSVDFAITDPEGTVYNFNLSEENDEMVARDLEGRELGRVDSGLKLVETEGL